MQTDINEQASQLCKWYGDGSDGSCPTLEQWKGVLAQPSDKPITLINFFKLRETALYKADDSNADMSASGNDAFNSYATVSIPTMERLGGKFLHVGPFVGTFLGDNEEWDVVAIGSYPNLESFLALYTDEAYRKAFAHRTAACVQQKVLICANAD